MCTHLQQLVARRDRFWTLAALMVFCNCAQADDTVGAAQLDRQLSQMEEELRALPAEYAPASRYRARCAASGRHDRSIKFFEGLLAARSNDERVRIELASAYIDKIPTCSGLTAFMRRGTLARKSLKQLDPVIASDRDSWLAHYCRGMNHLHWPRVLGHTSDAIADFERCIELQQPDTPGNIKPYYVRSYVGLGDARTKAKQYDQAREAWRDGLKRFPQSAELKERLAVQGNSALLKFVESKRSLDKPVDTELEDRPEA